MNLGSSEKETKPPLNDGFVRLTRMLAPKALHAKVSPRSTISLGGGRRMLGSVTISATSTPQCLPRAPMAARRAVGDAGKTESVVAAAV